MQSLGLLTMVVFMVLAALAGNWLGWSDTATDVVTVVGAIVIAFTFVGLEGLPRTTDDDQKRRSHLG
ncbi:MAG TPA: hypothetical protein VF529_02335 [Solirubrobacteraceae bacterium]|jgi:uncharacterized membrane protein